jgi:hypothetical protein
MISLVSRPFGNDIVRLQTQDLAFFGVMAGGLIGTIQWLLLRFQRSYKKISWWIWSSLFGWAQSIESQIIQAVLFGATLGTAVGIAQGFLIRRAGMQISWWLLANILGFSLSGLAVVLLDWRYWGTAIGFGLSGLALIFLSSKNTH